MTSTRQYIAIDLKSFYASVECVERGLDPLDTCLVVADIQRTEKTICLAVSPALKEYGTGGRPRLFEVVQRVRDVNNARTSKWREILEQQGLPFSRLRSKSYSKAVLDSSPDVAVDYIVAPPHMARYVDYSTRIYKIYLRWIAPEDIHVYSIDEVFIDATDYLKTYRMTAHQLAMTMIRQVLAETGVTATAGIGTNLYLCKIAMDIVAKKMKPDADGVRIAELDEMSFRHKLWSHRPLTDFWRIGHGTASRLEKAGIFTMGDLARCSLNHQDFLFKVFGVNAELLIDHAWGWEPVEMHHVKAYRPETHSMSSGQVLHEPYTPANARNVALEMADAVALDLVREHVVTDQMTLTIGYDTESLRNPEIYKRYTGKVHMDWYGRPVPEHSHGTINLRRPTSSGKTLIAMTAELFDRIVNPGLLIRRLTISLNHLVNEDEARRKYSHAQLNLFSNFEEEEQRVARENLEAEQEHKRQQAIINIKNRFGKNAILKGINFAEGATQRDRNKQIGGHQE